MGEFKKRQKRRFIFSMLFLAFWLPALLISFMESEAQQIFGANTFAVEMALKAFGLVFILMALVNSKCPSCNKNAGNGWCVKSCKACGEKVA